MAKVNDPIDPVICFIGLILAPGLTFSIILWKLKHPVLATLVFIGMFLKSLN